MANNKSFKFVNIHKSSNLLKVIAALGAVLACLAFNYQELFFLVIIGFYLLIFSVVEEEKPLNAMFNGWLYGFTFFLINCWWLSELKPFVFLPFLLAFYEGIFFAVPALALKKFFSTLTRYKQAYLAALLFFLFDFLRGAGTYGFPWAQAGFFIAGTPIRDSLLLYGHMGVSLILWLLSSAFYGLQKNRKTPVIIILLLVVLVTPVYLVKENTTENNVKVALISENLTPEEKHLEMEGITGEKILNRLMNLYREAVSKNPDLIVFPETSFPYQLEEKPEWLEKFKDDSVEQNMVIIVGSFKGDSGKSFNSLYVFDKGRYLVYSKKHLVPFGEFVPYREYIPWVEVLKDYQDLSEGGEPAVIKTSIGNVGLGICWESAIPGLGREYALKGANILIFSTNDNWFGHSMQGYQHWKHTISQSDSTGLYVVQSANGGVTGRYGNGEQEILDPWKRGVLTTTIKVKSSNQILLITQRYIEIIILFISSLLLLFGIIFSLIKQIKEA